MSLAQLLRPADGDPEGALVLFHGRGTGEHDLFPLLDELDPERRLLGATPRGPLSLPPGGAHWYVIREVGFPTRETFGPPTRSSPAGSTACSPSTASRSTARSSAASRRAPSWPTRSARAPTAPARPV